VGQEAVQEDALNGQKAKEVVVGPCEVAPRGRKAKSTEVLGIKHGLLYQKRMLWIPEDGALIKTILVSQHDSKVAGHIRQDITIQLVGRNFWWPKMDERMIAYVRGCPE